MKKHEKTLCAGVFRIESAYGSNIQGVVTKGHLALSYGVSLFRDGVCIPSIQRLIPGGTYKKFVLDNKANTFKLEDATQDLLGLASVVRVRNIQINDDKGENVPTSVEGDNCILRIAENFTWTIKVGDELRCIPYWLYPDSRYPSYETPNGTIAIYKWMAGCLGSVHFDKVYPYTNNWWWKKPKTWWWTERKNWIKRLLPYEARCSVPGKEGFTSRHRTLEKAQKAIERTVCSNNNWCGVL